MRRSRPPAILSEEGSRVTYAAISETDPKALAHIIRDAITGERNLDKMSILYTALANRRTRLGTLVAVRRHESEQREPDVVIAGLLEAAIAEKKSRK